MVEKQNVEIVKDDSNHLARETYKHPAFGMIGFSRVSGGDNVLFGSSVKHNNKISITIKRAECDRSLHNDFYLGKGTILEAEMSYSQFAECISSLNVGNGVPCTLRMTERDGEIPAIADTMSKRETFREEFSQTIKKAMEQVQAQIDEIQKSLDSKKDLGVKARKEMISALNIVKSNIGANLNFCVDEFDRQMDKSAVEAKGEVEAFFQNKVYSLAASELTQSEDHTRIECNPVDVDL